MEVGSWKFAGWEFKTQQLATRNSLLILSLKIPVIDKYPAQGGVERVHVFEIVVGLHEVNAELEVGLHEFIADIRGKGKAVIGVVRSPGETRAIGEIEPADLEPVAELGAHDFLLEVVIELQIGGMRLRLDELELLPLALDPEIEVEVFPLLQTEVRPGFDNIQLAVVELAIFEELGIS